MELHLAVYGAPAYAEQARGLRLVPRGIFKGPYNLLALAGCGKLARGLRPARLLKWPAAGAEGLLPARRTGRRHVQGRAPAP